MISWYDISISCASLLTFLTTMFNGSMLWHALRESRARRLFVMP